LLGFPIMLKRFFLLTLPLSVLLGGRAVAQDSQSLVLATTTGTYDSGLLDTLLPRFEREHRVKVKIIAVGTGAALAMARRGDADAVLVHAPEREREYVASGDLIEGRLIMHNDFVLVGTALDPAGVRSCQDLPCAMRAIARAGPFISRGDRSGTHEMELALWRQAGIAPDSARARAETGQGMGATLDIAVQRSAYTLTDRGTFMAHPAGRQLQVVFEGDPILLNVYHAYAVNPERHPRTNLAGARAFVAFMADPVTQQAIGRFGRERYGRSLYIPDVGRDSMRLHQATP
jgi:tungstate transport system substrate-binding protein